MNTRTKFLASAMTVALLSSSLTAMGQSGAGGPVKNGLEGSWRVTGTPGPNRPPFVPETVEALATYDAGGGFVSTDNLALITAHGSWQYAGDGKFNTTVDMFLRNAQGQVDALLHVRGTLTLNSAQDGFTTVETIEIRGFPSGVVFFAYDGASAVGTRIAVEPIE
jgi:hypothetical protein